ncbi:biotin-dependent carboxyltransferase family protein [Halomonas sp. V046]|uniref:5-oxoprolinase subunit C family protein n=1 Tax=Halomonas sp. V046 TaxID=3459611 RepID=UPI004044370F
MSLRVQQTGPMALVVDGGRVGVRHLGVTQGGAMDWVSLGWANWLLGNAHDAAGIEILVGGLELAAEADMTLALGGADLGATLDGQVVAPDTRFAIRRGQRLAFHRPQAGLRAYLAVPGGIAATPLMGSVSSTLREGLGGLDGFGKALVKGDVIKAAASQAGEAPRAAVPARLPDTAQPVTLKVVIGAQVAAFDGRSLYRAFHDTWTVDQRADRMGIRLTGPELDCELKGIVSEGIPLGAVQVPPDGQPIILMNDRQTIGGYPRLGALSPLACAGLAQCLPGTEVRLVPTTPERARRALCDRLAGWRR